MPIQYLEEIDALGLTKDEYVILGSAAAMAIGYPKDSNDDIDIYVIKSAFDRIADKLTTVDKANRTMYTNASGHLDINFLTDVFSHDPDEAFRLSHVVDGYRYLDHSGLVRFYVHLVNSFTMEKHHSILVWLVTEMVRGAFAKIDKERQ